MARLLLRCVPDDLDVEADDYGHVVTVPVCDWNDGTAFLALDCRLDPMPDHDLDMYEFAFGFTISEPDGGGLASQTQDRYEVERYFDGLSRQYVLPTICAALCALVDDIEPSYIFRVTKGLRLPQKALAKHALLTDTLLGLGFQIVDSGTDEFERVFWLMGR